MKGNDQTFTFVSMHSCGGFQENMVHNMYKKKGYRGEKQARDVLGCTKSLN